MSKSFFSASSTLLIDRFFRAGIGLVVGILIARHYGPEEFGQLSYVLLAATLFGSLATLGLDEIGPRDMASLHPDHPNRGDMLTTILRIRFLGGLVAYLLLVLFVYLELGIGTSYWIALILGLYLPLQSSDAYDYRFRAENKFSSIAVTRSFSAFCSATLKVASVILGLPIYVVVFAMTGEYGLNNLLFFWLNKSQFGKDSQFDVTYTKLLLSRSWKIMLAGIVMALQIRVEYFLIEKFLDWNSVGQYSAALKIFEILEVVPIIFAMVLMPKLAASLQEKSKNQLSESFQRSYLGGIAIYLALLPIMGLIIWVFPYAFGEKYLAAEALLPLLIIRPLFGMLSAIRGVFVIIEHNYFYPLIASSLGFAISLMASLTFIPKFGLIGAVIANLAGLFGSTILADLLFYRKSSIALVKSFQQLPFAFEKLRSFSLKS